MIKRFMMWVWANRLVFIWNHAPQSWRDKAFLADYREEIYGGTIDPGELEEALESLRRDVRLWRRITGDDSVDRLGGGDG